MRKTMSGEFVMSFVSTCMEAGLSKEAAAELLQRQSVVHMCEQSDDWREGYEKVASMVPGALAPMFREGYMDKSAAGPSNWLRAGSAIKALFGAGAGIAKDTAKGLWRAPGQVNKSLGGSKFIKNNPLLSAAAGGTLAAGVGISANKLFGGNGGGADSFDVNVSPSGYDPNTANSIFDAELDRRSIGIAEHNKKYFNDDKRRQELQAAIDRNDIGSGAARSELNSLNASHATVSNARANYLKEFTEKGNASEAKLQEIKERQKDLEAHKTSILYAPYRGYLRMTGRDPNAVYNQEQVDLQGQAANVNTANRLLAEQKRRMEVGYDGGSTKSRSPSELQNDFFPARN